MSKKSSLFLIVNFIVLFSPYFLSASTNQSSFDEEGEKTALSRFYSLMKRQHQRSHESVVKHKTSFIGTFEKHKRAFHGWIQSLTDRIQTLDFRSTSKSKEEVFSPYLMNYRPGKSEFDPDEKLEFKRTDMFDNVEFFTIGERAYFKKKRVKRRRRNHLSKFKQ